MYFIIIALFLLILPAGSVAYEMSNHSGDLIALIGKWFTFWAVGVRLGVAGLRQTFDPGYTAREIFEIQETSALPIVQELGFANISMGFVGAMSLLISPWIQAAALVGGLYYLLAGVKHVLNREKRNAERSMAMISDLFIALVLGFYLAATYVM
ncbi:MAG: DUF6790 family protein [Vitreimonas sp.]